MDDETSVRLVELVEKVALLRRDLKQKGDLDRYAARVNRVEQKLHALVEHVQPADPDLARALRTAWERPAMSLAYRNAEHQKRDDV